MGRRLKEIVLRPDPSGDVEEQLLRLVDQRVRAEHVDDTVRGIPYLEQLAGAQGMCFVLLPGAGTTREQLERAHSQLQVDRDVVECRWVNVERYATTWARLADRLEEKQGGDQAPAGPAQRPRSTA